MMLEDLEDLGKRHSADEAAKIIGVNYATLARWREKGEGPPYMKIGQAYYYPSKWLIKWLRSTVVCPSGQCPDEGEDHPMRRGDDVAKEGW